MNLIEVTITKEMLARARKTADELGTLQNSITHGQGNLAGFVGEEVAQSVLGGELANTRDYDLILEDEKKIDVKTKRCTSPPKGHYECSVADFNTSQKCDEYVFVRVMKDFSKGWILGKAIGVSADGLTVVGTGTNPQGETEAWIVRLTLVPADLDGDGEVGVPDLLLLLAQWGPCPPTCLGDINGDGSVNVPDLLTLLANWGACP